MYRYSSRIVASSWLSFAILAIAVSTPLVAADDPTPIAPPPGIDAPAITSDPRLSGYQLEGMASWYGGKFQGRLTANGEIFDTNQLTAAHRELPFGTIVRVINRTNDRVVVVRINDRGPFVDNRVIDLSRAAADIIGLTAAGVAPVTLEVMHYQEESDLRTIQVGSFGDRANADAMAHRLRNEGLDAVIETVANAGVHRVVIQAVPESDLPEVRDELAGLGHRNVLVRQK